MFQGTLPPQFPTLYCLHGQDIVQIHIDGERCLKALLPGLLCANQTAPHRNNIRLLEDISVIASIVRDPKPQLVYSSRKGWKGQF